MQPVDGESIAKLTATLEGMRDFVFLETCRFSEGNTRSLLFTNPVCWIECAEAGDPEEFLQRVEDFRLRGYVLAGWFAYEFGYLLEPALSHCSWPNRTNTILARLGVFEQVLVFDHEQGKFSGGERWPEGGNGHQSNCAIDDLHTNISEQEFLADVETIQEYIRAGDTYQVNYTLNLDFSFTGSVALLYRQLRRNQSVAYAGWLRCGNQDILSFSPELFFSVHSGMVRVCPMKGTMKRGRTRDEDVQQAEKLCGDAKSRSENVMIVDLLRNDLARLLHESGGGRVHVRSLFDVECYESLLQMTSTIEGIPLVPRSSTLVDMLKALFPCGSVTGAPKIRTMEIIRELEKRPRGVYCGAIGYCGRDIMCFNVPIRTLTLTGGKGSMGVGAGIVHDSEPRSEWRECLLKGRFLTRPQPEFQLIETLCWQPDAGYVLLQEHLERLADSANYFFFRCAIDDIGCRLRKAEEEFSHQTMRVRLLLQKDGRMDLQSFPLQNITSSVEHLPRVAFSNRRTDAADVFLYHKTTVRGIYDQERERAVHNGLYEVLFINTREEVTEGAISNLFAEVDGIMYTPPVSCGLLAGTYRRFQLDGGRAVERVLTVDDVAGADALYVANSMRGLVRVRLVDIDWQVS